MISCREYLKKNIRNNAVTNMEQQLTFTECLDAICTANDTQRLDEISELASKLFDDDECSIIYEAVAERTVEIS